MENLESNTGLTRRDLLKATGTVAATSALAGVVLPRHVFAGETNTIQIGLVGAGGRGTGAASNALSTTAGPVKLTAIADVMPERLKGSYNSLQGQFKEMVDVPEERKFIGFDGYKNVMDSLKKGDIVILTTPPGFRWVQFKYAIERGLNVFMEKPTTVDGPGTRKMFDLYEESLKKNLKVGVGLMCRHCEARGELFDRIQNGEMGELNMLRGYRVSGPTAKEYTRKNQGSTSELLYQIQNFHSFLWASGGSFSDFLIHNIDECCWMKNAWPVEAKGYGGRHYRGDFVDQNFDHYTIEYTFADGAKLFMEGRCMVNCSNEFASYCHGSKGSAVISQSGHMPSHARIFKGQKMVEEDVVWRCKDPEPNPYQLEWDHLMQAIRQDKKYNEAKRGAEASLVTSMGRMACHTGRTITFDEMLNCEHEFAPDIDKLTLDGPAPLIADASGKYPVPAPGIKSTREY